MPPEHHRTRWFLLTVAAFTLGAGLAQVAISHRDLAPSVVAAPALDPVGRIAPPPPPQVHRGEPHPAPGGRPVTPTRVVARPVRPAPRSQPHHAVVTRHATAPSFEQAMHEAVARIPWYRPGVATWVVYPRLANYGVTDRERRVIYISPRTPRALLYSVVAHEWGHVISTTGYANLSAADAAVTRWFGIPSASRAIEIAADCIARDLGATWTHYTACTDRHWRYGARYLMVGWQLPEQQSTAE